VTQWRVSAAAWALAVTAVAAVVAGVAIGPPAGALAGAVALCAGGVMVWTVPPQRWRLWSFSVTEDAVELHHGLLDQVHSVVPHFRVQHIAVERGVLERRLGLARLTITTASSGGDTHIPGLAPERADAIRRHILDRTASGDAV
jgi:membrane protein YdbS with pleckstrin-like domain